LEENVMGQEKLPDSYGGTGTAGIDISDVPQWVVKLAGAGTERLSFEDLLFSEDGPIEELRPLLSYVLMAVIKGNPDAGGASDEARLGRALAALVGSPTKRSPPEIDDDAILVEVARAQLRQRHEVNGGRSLSKIIEDIAWAHDPEFMRADPENLKSAVARLKPKFDQHRDRYRSLVNTEDLEERRIPWAHVQEAIKALAKIGVPVKAPELPGAETKPTDKVPD
jgi:hypothetical protein